MSLLRAFVRYFIPSIALVGCNVSKPAPTAASPQPAPHVPTAPVVTAMPAQPKADSSILSVATFKGDELVDCVTVSAEVPTPSPNFRASNVTALLVDDFLTAADGGESVLREDRGAVAVWLRKLDEPNEQAMNSGSKKGSKAKVSLAQLSWPTPNFTKEAKAGEVSKVDSCAIPNHVPLGTCELREDGLPAPWRITDYVFSVEKAVDSDAAMKNCLSLGGKWSAADATDPKIARERMRQHAHGLQKIARELAK